MLRLGFSLNSILPCYLAMVMGNNEINKDKKFRQIAGNFDCHTDAAIRCGVHWPMEHIHGFTRSHSMPPLVKCLLRHIALAAAMVIDFEWNTHKTNKTQHLAIKYCTNWSLLVYENFIPEMDPLPSSSMQQASLACETPQLKRSRTFVAIKCWQGTKSRKVIKQSWSSLEMVAHMCTISG